MVLEYYDYIILFCLGSLGAFISGFLGVGGGIVFIPILDFFLSKMGLRDGDLVKGILANSLFTIIFSGSIASYKQYRINNFYPREILSTAVPGMFSALFMTWLIKQGDWYSKETFNYVFLFMLVIILLKMFLSKTKESKEGHIAPPKAYGITGFFTGMVTALSGLGGGVIMTPVFTDILKQPIRKASSISNGVIPLFAIIIGIYNLSSSPAHKVSDWQAGYIVFPVVLPMILATFIFAPVGVKASHKTDQVRIRYVFALFVLLTLGKLVYEMIK